MQMVEDADRCKAPVLTMLGTSTPERLASVSSIEDLEDGWWPRWIMVWPQGRPPVRPLDAADAESVRFHGVVKQELERIDRRLRNPVAAVLTPDAWAATNEAVLRRTAAAGDDEQYAAFYARTDVRLLKVAALLALADDRRVSGAAVGVEATHITQADTLVGRWLDDALRFAAQVGLNDFESALNRALLTVSRRGMAHRRDIARATHVPARLMDDIERTLLDRGLIEVVDIKTDGRIARGWRSL